LIKNSVYSHEIWTLPDEEKDNVKEIHRWDVVHVYTPEWGDNFDCQWTIIKSDITTRGIWDQWLNVNRHN
jgi:hypothetical protein